MMIPVPKTLDIIAEKLSRPIYLVGGYVRNYLLFSEVFSTDIDICGSLSYDVLKDELEGVATVLPVNPRIGTVLIKCDGDRYEYTAFRRDSYPIGGKHTPNSVEFVSTPEEDALRRDFTANAVYYDVKARKLVDVLNGVKDIASRTLRTANVWQKTFGEDGLRLLRAVRFSAQLGFSLSEECYAGAKACAELLSDVSAERKMEEMDMIFTSDVKYGVKNAHLNGVKLACELGLLRRLYKGAEQELADVTFDEKRFKPFECSSPENRLAAFVYCVRPKSMEKFLRALRYSNKRSSETLFLLRAIYEVHDENELKRRLVKAPYLTDRLAELGFLTGNPYCAEGGKVLARLKEKGVPLSIKELNFDGNELESIGIVAEKRGKAVNALFETCLNEERPYSHEEQVAFLKKYTN